MKFSTYLRIAGYTARDGGYVKDNYLAGYELAKREWPTKARAMLINPRKLLGNEIVDAGDDAELTKAIAARMKSSGLVIKRLRIDNVYRDTTAVDLQSPQEKARAKRNDEALKALERVRRNK